MTNRFHSTPVVFACLKCGQAYRAIQQGIPHERPGRFDCIKCNAEVHTWRGFFDFAEWETITLGPSDPFAREPHYEVLEAADQSFTVKIYGGEGAEATVTQFASREEAVAWVRNERRKIRLEGGGKSST
jgi:hypothetical protein